MITSAARAPRYWRIVGMRWLQLVGWPGTVGAFCLVSALAWASVSWQRQVALQDLIAAVPSGVSAPRTPSTASSRPVVALPTYEAAWHPVSELGPLLGLLHQRLSSHGLSWLSADYRVIKATAAVPAHLEIQANLKGSYLGLRAALAKALPEVAGLSLRQLAITRASPEVADLEVKILFYLYLNQSDEFSGETR